MVSRMSRGRRGRRRLKRQAWLRCGAVTVHIVGVQSSRSLRRSLHHARGATRTAQPADKEGRSTTDECDEEDAPSGANDVHVTPARKEFASGARGPEVKMNGAMPLTRRPRLLPKQTAHRAHRMSTTNTCGRSINTCSEKVMARSCRSRI